MSGFGGYCMMHAHGPDRCSMGALLESAHAAAFDYPDDLVSALFVWYLPCRANTEDNVLPPTVAHACRATADDHQHVLDGPGVHVLV